MPILEAEHIQKTFDHTQVLKDISFSIAGGEICALLGENGAGKSTLMSVLFGLYQPEQGEIRIDGKRVEIRDPNDANTLHIGMVHQHFKLVECFSVLDNIILGVETTIQEMKDRSLPVHQNTLRAQNWLREHGVTTEG